MEVQGSCHCGQIRFVANIDPSRTRICHCTDCQKLSGAPFRVTAPVSEPDFDLISGKPKIYIKLSDSGNERQQAFCPECGTPIYATSNDRGPRKFGIRVGAIEGGRELVPRRQFWTDSAVDWLEKVPEMLAVDRQ